MCLRGQDRGRQKEHGEGDRRGGEGTQLTARARRERNASSGTSLRFLLVIPDELRWTVHERARSASWVVSTAPWLRIEQSKGSAAVWRPLPPQRPFQWSRHRGLDHHDPPHAAVARATTTKTQNSTTEQSPSLRRVWIYTSPPWSRVRQTKPKCYCKNWIDRSEKILLLQ